MKTKTINLYTFNELSKEAQLKAHTDWQQHNDYPFMNDDMAERLHELLEENNIKDLNDTSKVGTKPTPVYYSLSNRQGDGAMFAGTFEYKGHQVEIKHSGHYFHSNSKTINWLSEFSDTTFDEIEISQELQEEFESLYQKICKELETYGYDYIENEDSLETFVNTCEANDYTFTIDGKMENL